MFALAERLCKAVQKRVFCAGFLTILLVTGAIAAEVMISNKVKLDGPRGYCLDVPGHGTGMDVGGALVVHTCKDGMWHVDELFDSEAVKAGQLKLSGFQLCVAADGPIPRPQVRLAA